MAAGALAEAGVLNRPAVSGGRLYIAGVVEQSVAGGEVEGLAEVEKGRLSWPGL